jgi:hypothetical protein
MKKSTTAQKTKQTAKATNVVTSKAVAKQEKQETTKSKKVVYLTQNVTGKMFQDSKIETNKAIKVENFSFSFCLKQVLKHDKGFTNSILNFKETDCTPKNLLPLLKGKEAKSGKFSSWLVMQLISRFYKK